MAHPMSSGSHMPNQGNGHNPDKRTTAYENIFGRPTVKPKGPSAYPSAGPPPNPATYNWVNQQAYASNVGAPQVQPQLSRYNGGGSINLGSSSAAMPGPSAGPYRQPFPHQASQSQSDLPDRRVSAVPSVVSQQDGTQTYHAQASGGSEFAGPSASPSPAPSYNGYYSHQSAAPSAQDPIPYRNPSVPPNFQRPDPYGVRSALNGNGDPYATPRLPSFDLGLPSTQSDDMWFNTANDFNIDAPRGTAGTISSSAHGTSSSTMDTQTNTATPSNYTTSLATRPSTATRSSQSYKAGPSAPGSVTEVDAMEDNDFENYQRQLMHRSAAPPYYNRGSFESDRQSIANSLNTLPAATSRMQIGNSYFAQPSAQTIYTGEANGSMNWDRQHRMRTISSATTQGVPYGGAPPDWNRPPEAETSARSLSFGQGSAKNVPTSTRGSGNANVIPPIPSQLRKGPVVYPALLSRVAEAFKMRVSVGERTKDGLTYTDSFDGREAVDKIAYIIKTTDRNLALLLGRALDAQKLFHDVTYDHRLRDSPNELYQFRVRLTNPFDSDTEQFQPSQAHLEPTTASRQPTRDNSFSTLQENQKPLSTSGGESAVADEDEDALPTGVFTLLTDCYSPTCTRDRLCYSIACPRRLEQQARLNMKPQPGLKRSISRESLGDIKEPGALWADSVSAEVLSTVTDGERKRQELLNEVVSTERDFVRDLEYLRDHWIKPLRAQDIIPDSRREDFVTQVFWNVLEIHAVNSKLAEMLTKRQKQQAVVDRIGDIFLEMVPHFSPFVKYGAHQLYGKYEFEKEKSSNAAFAKFVDEVERKPESRKLELNGYLTKPTTRLARYPLLLEAVLKATPEEHADKQTLPKVIKIVKEFLSKVNAETGKSENRFNLAQLDQQLVFKQGEAVDLRLRDEQRELVFKGPLKKRGGSQSDSAELQVFLFDHALLMVKAKTVHKNDLFKVYRKPIPLELLIVTVYDEVATGKGSSTRPKSVMSKTSTGNRLSGSVPTGTAPKQDQKTGYALTFTYLGRKGYSQTLWASTFVSRMKWFEHIESRQDILRQRSNIFETITLSENFFMGPMKVTCSVPFDFGRRIIYGAEDGVYLSDLRERARPPTKVLPLPGVTQVDVLEEYQILIILAEKSVHTFTLDALDPTDPVGSLKRGRRISSHTSFFKAGQCLGRTLVCVVKSSSLSSTIKTLEPIEQNLRVGKKQQTFRKLLQGGQESLRVFKEFYIPTESSSIHFLKTKLCVGCTKGFEIVDLETLDTQGLLDPADSNLDFVQKKENVKPIAIYRIDGDFLLCYDEFAFYVNKNGWRAKGNWIIHWEGNPTSFALHHPYVLAFEPSFVEVRHVHTGALHQVITGYNLRCLFADVPPPATAAQMQSLNQMQNPPMAPFGRPPPGPPMHYAIGSQHNPALTRHQSFNMMGGPQAMYGGAGGAYGAGPGRPVVPQATGPYGAPGGPGYSPQMYPVRPAPPHHMPTYPYGQPMMGRPPPPPQLQQQRNPVWESVAASRSQIVFIGDTTVFAVRPAQQPAASTAASSTA